MRSITRKSLRPEFLVAILILISGIGYVGYSVSITLRSLDSIELERDGWQQPAGVLNVLDLHSGSVVADLGSGSGYFALKLSKAVDKDGKVIAIDLRRLSLAFLWMRTVEKSINNVQLRVGETEKLPPSIGSLDAVLIANTFHELRNSRSMLASILNKLRPGGRVVILDRNPPAGSILKSGAFAERELGVDEVEHKVRSAGFEILQTTDPYISPERDSTWWFLVAQRPMPIERRP